MLKKEKIERLRSTAISNRCPALQVFVSSTFLDLEKERLAAKRAIQICSCVPILAEDIDSLPGRNLPSQIPYWLARIDILILLVSERYGELSHSNVSWTEEEVATAVRLNKVIFPYYIKTRIPKGLELDQDKRKRLNAFREWLSSNAQIQPAQYPRSIPDLIARIVRDINAFQSDRRIDLLIGEFEKISQWEE